MRGRISAKAAQLSQSHCEKEHVCEDGRQPAALATHMEGMTCRATQSGKGIESSSCLPPVLLEGVQNATLLTAKHCESELGNCLLGSVKPDFVLRTACKRGYAVPPRTDDSQVSAALTTWRINTNATQWAVASAHRCCVEKVTNLLQGKTTKSSTLIAMTVETKTLRIVNRVILGIKNLPNVLVTTLPIGINCYHDSLGCQLLWRRSEN